MAKKKDPQSQPSDDSNKKPRAKKVKKPKLVFGIFKLLTGEDIMASYYEEGDYYCFNYPLRILRGSVKQGNATMDVFSFSKWIGNSLQHKFKLPKSSVLISVEPDPFTIEKYKSSASFEQLMDAEMEMQNIARNLNKDKELDDEINLDHFDQEFEDGIVIDGDTLEADEDDLDEPHDHNSRFTF